MVIILHVSDMHCASHKVAELLERETYDLVLATGDFECVDTAEAVLARSHAPVYAVTGNMDDPSIARVLRDAGALLDGRTATVMGLRIGGVGGLDPASSIASLERRLDGEGLDILISHHPPKGVLDRTFIGVRIGLKELWPIIEKARPGLHAFGHVHEARGVEERGGTVFVNAGPLSRGNYAVITRQGRGWKADLRKL